MPKILILYSKRDIAGTNIADTLRKKFESNGEVKILGNDNVLFMQDFKETPEICIVASRHRSESGKPTLTCHSPGNFGAAELGGNPMELGISPANYLSECINLLKSNPVQGYEITLEVTHHGPTGLKFPVMFVEIGSGEKEWNDEKACSAVAECIFALTRGKQEKLPVAIGFGGGHYCRKFTELTNEYAIGHICPKYNLQNIDGKTLEEMIEKTVPTPEFALIDKKGMGSERRRILEILKSTNLEIAGV